jgi:hypothetical protein
MPILEAIPSTKFLMLIPYQQILASAREKSAAKIMTNNTTPSPTAATTGANITINRIFFINHLPCGISS